MRNGNYFDVLIVGAGPAGSSAARAAAEEGAAVLVIERKRRIGEPVRCAEYVPRLLAQTVKIPSEAIAQEILGMITFMPDGGEIRKSAPGFILNRARFDQALAMDARRAGARILTGTRAISREREIARVRGPSGTEEFKTSVIIGADGPDSIVGSWVGQKNRRVLSALQHTVVLKQPASETEVYLGREYPGGYAWLFPKGEKANVGVGIQAALGGKLKQALASFKERLGDRIGGVVGMTAGRIPAGGPLPSIDEEARIILVGDAAGQTHAITGGGIPQAVICGQMAGRAAAAFAGGDSKALKGYLHEWEGTFGPMLEKAARRRVEMEVEWESGDLAGLLRRSWVACREYYHEP
ncbi:MAG: NAD(P)/FAD-dependent oxidoreductase [Pseudomonadota bacterium]